MEEDAIKRIDSNSHMANSRIDSGNYNGEHNTSHNNNRLDRHNGL